MEIFDTHTDTHSLSLSLSLIHPYFPSPGQEPHGYPVLALHWLTVSERRDFFTNYKYIENGSMGCSIVNVMSDG